VTSVLAYKFLRPGAVGPFSGHRWPTPGDGEQGPWVETSSWTGVCRDGVHGCERRHLPLWIWEELWEVELAGEVEAEGHKLRARRGRLVRRIETWRATAAKAFASVCARRAAEHAAGPLREAGHGEAAALFGDATNLQAVRDMTAQVWESLPLVARIPTGMASDGALRALTAEASDDRYVAAHGAAVSAYISAMTAMRVAGRERYDAERAWQADWLSRELGLD
jgi:hypothetical protein